jgi:DNA-binding transcriptional LysR family regulator
MRLPANTPELSMLDLLVSVAETGSLGRAAHRHGITQPAASMRISTLERQLGLVLLDRGPTGSRLTTAGAAVVDWARPVLEAADTLVSGVTALRTDQPDRLRVAASMTIADHRIPRWLIALRATAPDIRVALRVGNSSQVADLVLEREADIGFVEGPHAPRGLRSKVVGADELVVVVDTAHAWARRRRPLSLAELAATPLVTREVGSGTRDAAWEVLRSVAEPVAPAAELGSTTAIKSAVAAGVGPAVLSRLAVALELEDRRLIAVPLADSTVLRRRFRAIWRREGAMSPAAEVMLTIADANNQRR